MKSLPLFLLLIAGRFAVADRWHPEWGPEPPVAPYTKAWLPSRHTVAPMIFPLLGAAKWKDGYNVNRGKFRHTGIDIQAPKMTPIVAPFSGELGLKHGTFWIYGDNGWAVLGTHLNDDYPGKHDHRGGWDVMFAPNLRAGMHVIAGQFLGYVGESGDATGPHLHFELYAPGAGSTFKRIRNPFASLKMSQVLRKPRPVMDRLSDRPSKGEVRLDGCVRKVDERAGTVTLLVFARQTSNGRVQAATQVEYMKIALPEALAAKCGGWKALAGIGQSDVVSAYIVHSGWTVRANRIVVDSGKSGT